METGSILFTLPERFNYAMQQNGSILIRDLQITNNTEDDWEDLDYEIVSEPEFCKKYVRKLERVPAGETVITDVSDLLPNGDYLAAISSEVRGSVSVRLKKGDEVLSESSKPIEILTYDQFPDWLDYGLLASFVLPNHPALAPIINDTSVFLGEWTKDPSLNGYQSEDPERVRNQFAALYKAIQKLNLSYIVPPANFVQSGQRIRLPETILEERMGTCLDLALLFAGCLERMGLNPLVVLFNDHAFTGVWLDDKTFSDVVQDDVAALTKNTAEGIHHIALAECTCVTSGHCFSFDEAEKQAEIKLTEIAKFDNVIDIRQARRNGIKPIPIRVKTEEGWKVIVPVRPESELTHLPGEVHRLDLSRYADQKSDLSEPRSSYWEHHLLDLSLNNPLLNMKLRKATIPLLAGKLGDLEDDLSENTEFLLVNKPDQFSVPDDFFGIMEMKPHLGQWGNLLVQEQKNKRLRTILTERELQKSALELFRRAKVSLEENGANTLYLALGFLRWYEKPDGCPARYSPIILLPVELKRKSGSTSFSIQQRDEEIQINITLLEMLRERFQIAVNNLDPLPTDDKGIDLVGIFTIIRNAIFAQKGWDVVENAVLGIFSFTQFVMWNDLKNNMDKLRRNKIVSSLLDEKLSWVPDPFPSDNDLEEGMLVPIAADATQLVAIKAAAEGKSFVLHGPPGTGKSQTITNIITNALAQGQKVLFVAEKMAALSVVQKRLERIGLGPYCLELHSNKSMKKDVLDQLDEALKAGNHARAADFSGKTDDLAQRRSYLKKYVVNLHRKQPSGLTLYEQISRYETVRSAKDIIDPFLFSSKDANGSRVNIDVSSISGEKIAQWKDLLRRVCSHLQSMIPIREHPFKGVRKQEYTQALRQDVPVKIDAFLKGIDALERAGNNFCKAFSISFQGKKFEYDKLTLLAPVLITIDQIPMSWLEEKDFSALVNRLDHLIEIGRKETVLRKDLLLTYNPEFFDQNAEALQKEWTAIKGKWFLLRIFSNWRFQRKMKSFIGSPSDKIDWDQGLSDLRRYQDLRRQRKEKASEAGSAFAEFDREEDTDWEDLVKKRDHFTKCRDQLRSVFREKADLFMRKRDSIDAKTGIVSEYLAKWNEFAAARKDLFDLLEMDPVFGEKEDPYLIRLRERALLWQSSLGELRGWIQWQSMIREMNQTGLGSFAQICDRKEAAETIEIQFVKALLKKLIIYAFDSKPDLNSFSSRTFENQIAQYKKRMEEYEHLIGEETAGRLSEKIPDIQRAAANSSEIGILLKAIKSGGRNKSLRKLFAEIPNLLPRLCPCMLMSPISVAQYLDPGRDLFDLIVFDEASQLPTCKAIGALARGKNSVIVGDPKQLPPTSFFAASSSNDEDSDLVDLESILDDCLALAIPDTKLRWHYRSRHESLIAFSNRKYYGNELFTFPSVNDRISKVRLVPVPGHYDRSGTRTNNAEAKAVRDEVIRRLRDPELQKLSIGIVTFSSVQQNLIDDLISDALSKDPDLEQKIQNQEEPLFIKNLENVQGDERDVILFSIGYGPDLHGKVSLNFGPLNRKGGWRRLNVAISRARSEMIVFSTLKPDQIDLTRTSAEGIEGLKSFLEFASGKQIVSENEAHPEKNLREGIANAIAAHLNKSGYQCKLQVGRSGYRIDLGVFDPDDPEKYLLGILLDGNCYKNAKTVREREYAQADVLRGLGWRLLRIWSVEWWEDHDKILKRIIEEIEQIVKENRVQALEAERIKQKIEAEKTESEKIADQKSEQVRANLPCNINESKNAEESFAPMPIKNEDVSGLKISDSPSTVLDNNINKDSVIGSGVRLRDPVCDLKVEDGETKEIGENRDRSDIPADNPTASSDQPPKRAFEEIYVESQIDKVKSNKESFYLPANKKKITEQIKKIIDQEGPVSYSVLTKKLIASWGITRVSSRVEDRVGNILRHHSFIKTTELNTEYYWPERINPEEYKTFRVPSDSGKRRDLADISPREIAVAVFSILRDQIGMNESELIREVYKLFGFARSSEKIETWIKGGINIACDKKWARREDARISLGENG
ncbi:MAG: DUF3320 domain-containing protein [Planctomycetia bacterium]|nr:DUF3320 domain-containing protein [Planctomycetia bacterium]